MKKILFLVIISSFFGLKAQVFTYTASSTIINGAPGDALYYNISFYNPTTSSITIEFDRFTKYEPPYWYSCFCFITCHPPSVDFVNIEVPPNSWGPQMTILFKTDSVNPGQATASIKFNQVGFANNADTVHLVATTTIATGIKQTASLPFSMLYPNPTTGNFIFYNPQSDKLDIKLSDINGKTILRLNNVYDKEILIDLTLQAKGIYFLSVLYSNGKNEIKKIIKN